MRASWEALHAGLVRSVRVLKSGQSFHEMKAQHSVLASFDDAEAVVEYLASKAGDSEAKNQLLAVLVAMVQQRQHYELVRAVLWLGLWPGLDAVYHRRIRHFFEAPDELVSELSGAFVEHIERLDLEVVRRIAATLVRSTERDVMARRERGWRNGAKECWGDRDYEDVDVEGDDIWAGWFDIVSFRRWLGDDEGLALGLTSGVSFDEDVAVLRAWLAPVVGEDAELLLAVLVLDETQHEAGARLGLANAASRKRFQRATARLRRHLDMSLSRSTGPTASSANAPWRGHHVQQLSPTPRDWTRSRASSHQLQP